MDEVETTWHRETALTSRRDLTLACLWWGAARVPPGVLGNTSAGPSVGSAPGSSYFDLKKSDGGGLVDSSR